MLKEWGYETFDENDCTEISKGDLGITWANGEAKFFASQELYEENSLNAFKCICMRIKFKTKSNFLSKISTYKIALKLNYVSSVEWT